MRLDSAPGGRFLRQRRQLRKTGEDDLSRQLDAELLPRPTPGLDSAPSTTDTQTAGAAGRLGTMMHQS